MKYPLSALILACFMQTAAAADDSATMVDNLSDFRFDRLGHPQVKSDAIAPVIAAPDSPHRLLILPIAFSDTHYDRFAGDPEQDRKNREYFTQELFGGGVDAPEPGTLSDYFRHQSRGRYNVTGDILPTVELDKPLDYYGRPVQMSDGNWRADERGGQLVEDAILAAYRRDPDFPWRDYDQWDPRDFDGDGNRDEPDGYLDHLVMIVAGKGQASCHGLYKLDEKLTPNSPRDAFNSLTGAEQACADRIWPHRDTLSGNLGEGPIIDGTANPRGGVPLGNELWVADYNMQDEYTGTATFIHEFGHSLGLPDIYAASTSNSTGSWEVMSGTASPLPQEMSTWSRMVLGWLKPCVVRPPAFGGAVAGTLEMKTMSDWSTPGAKGLCDAAMIILPPKYRDIELGPLTAANGAQAIYSGQGNDVRRELSRQFDFTGIESGVPLLLSVDLWFEIEAEWDYLYIEAATDGRNFTRLMPTDKASVDDRQSVMPAGKGHEGAGSLPGFTGLSGDRDGDGKVESAAGCDPKLDRTLAEDKLAEGKAASDPCEVAQWVTATFDLESLRGKQATLRFNYFTDTASVENGALLDNISIAAIGFTENFEADSLEGWNSDGFTLSGGSHHLAVPHFYLLEYRDPYATYASGTNYDRALTEPAFMFYPSPDGEMQALNVNYRPGLLMWYYNGEYLWSQNEPAELGPGNGFLLVVDSNPQEFRLDAMPAKHFSEDEKGWTAWEFDDDAQPLLREGFLKTMCFQRRPDYYPSDVSESDRADCASLQLDGAPPMEGLSWNGRELMYGYTIVNELLPGADQNARKSGGSLFDLRLREGEVQYRLADNSLRDFHSADAPFALDEFASGLETYRGVDGVMTRSGTRPFAASSGFDDTESSRYLNPRLPFGGANIPGNGFSFELSPPSADSPAGTRVRVSYRWQCPSPGQCPGPDDSTDSKPVLNSAGRPLSPE